MTNTTVGYTPDEQLKFYVENRTLIEELREKSQLRFIPNKFLKKILRKKKWDLMQIYY